MSIPLGINVEFGGGTVENRERAMRRFRELQMETALTFNVSDAKELRQNKPDAEIIVRHYPDGGKNTALTESQWAAKYQDVAAAGFRIAVTNEDGVPTDWLCDPVRGILPNALRRGWKVNAPCVQVGVPNPDQYRAAFLPIFELAARYPGQLGCDFHEYFYKSPINGMTDHTTNAAAERWGPDYPLPVLDRAAGMRYWHLGRFIDFGLQVCDDAGLPHPLLFRSELGMELFPDPNNRATGATGPGWLGWRNDMKAHWPQWSPARTYAKMLIWIAEKLDKPFGVRSAIYCYGAVQGRTGDQDWAPFDIEGRTSGGTIAANGLDDFWDEMYQYAARQSVPEPPPVSPPPPIVIPPKEEDMWIPVVLDALDDPNPAERYANVRDMPTTKGSSVRWRITEPTIVQLSVGGGFPSDVIAPYGAGRWLPIRRVVDGPTFWVFNKVVNFVTPTLP